MSKTKLSKELNLLNKEQLIQLILDAYSARKETKEYLEFFLNPDINSLLDKYKLAIHKELKRVKRGHYCKARISFIKKQIKNFSSFQPGYQAEIELLLDTIKFSLECQSNSYFSDTLISGIGSLVTTLLDIANANLIADSVLSQLRTLLNHPHSQTNHFYIFLNNTIKSYFASSKPSIIS